MTEYVDELADALGIAAYSRSSPLARLRQKRETDLRLTGLPEQKTRGLRRALDEHDEVVDGLVDLAIEWEQEVDKRSAKRSIQLLIQRIEQYQAETNSWLGLWIAGAAVGLLAVVAGFAWSLFGDPPGWAWVSLTMAGLGGLVAALYTREGTRDLDPRTKWILLSLPVLVLLAAIVLPADPNNLGAVAVVVIALVALGVLSFEIVRRNPDRRDAAWLAVSRAGARDIPAAALATGDATEVQRLRIVGSELVSLQTRISLEARGQRAARLYWALTFIVIGGLAALASGAAGVAAAQQGSETVVQGGFNWVAGLAVLGGGLTALTTALNPGKRWEQAQTLNLECSSLEREVAALVRLDLGPLGPIDAKVGRERIEEISNKFDALLGVPERPRLWRRPPSNGSGSTSGTPGAGSSSM